MYACRDKKKLSRQNYVCFDKVFLSRQKIFFVSFRDKHVFIATKVSLSPQNFDLDKIMFVVTNICRDKRFVATKICVRLDEHVCVATKMILVAAPANDICPSITRVCTRICRNISASNAVAAEMFCAKKAREYRALGQPEIPSARHPSAY